METNRNEDINHNHHQNNNNNNHNSNHHNSGISELPHSAIIFSGVEDKASGRCQLVLCAHALTLRSTWKLGDVARVMRTGSSSRAGPKNGSSNGGSFGVHEIWRWTEIDHVTKKDANNVRITRRAGQRNTLRFPAEIETDRFFFAIENFCSVTQVRRFPWFGRFYHRKIRILSSASMTKSSTSMIKEEEEMKEEKNQKTIARVASTEKATYQEHRHQDDDNDPQNNNNNNNENEVNRSNSKSKMISSECFNNNINYVGYYASAAIDMSEGEKIENQTNNKNNNNNRALSSFSSIGLDSMNEDGNEADDDDDEEDYGSTTRIYTINSAKQQSHLAQLSSFSRSLPLTSSSSLNHKYQPLQQQQFFSSNEYYKQQQQQQQLAINNNNNNNEQQLLQPQQQQQQQPQQTENLYGIKCVASELAEMFAAGNRKPSEIIRLAIESHRDAEAIQFPPPLNELQ